MNGHYSHNDETSYAARLNDMRLQFPGDEHPLFDGLSLEIKKGEKVLLLGPSGSGKSTLLKVLSGLMPDTIEVPVVWEQRKSFNSWGYVFQDPDSQFCMPYVDEEIAFVLENRGIPRDRMPSLIKKYLQMVSLEFQEVHRLIATLSQGQKQRLALASALALEPEALLLDEPTALLDPEGTDAIWQQVRRISQDKTLLVIEHKIEKIIDYMDRVVVLDDQASIIIDTTPTQIQQEYQSLLDKYGVWHARSWSGYNPRMEGVKQADGFERKNIHKPLLKIEDVKGYREDELCITLPELEVQAGEWIAITGPNGAGKSTLLMALMHLIKTEGQFKLKGQVVKNTNQVVPEIGFLFQNPELQFVAQSVQQEVAFTLEQHQLDGQEKGINERVAANLEEFGLTELAEQNPYTLSTGQQRRLSVAATTVKERALLLLDEPTFGQDAANTFAILEQLEKYRRKGTALLMVTHEPQIVQRFATRNWVIRNGRLESDSPVKRTLKTAHGEASHAV